MLKWLIILVIAVVISVIANIANSGDLTVIVEQVRNSDGEIRLAIFDTPDQFPQGKKLDGKNVPAKFGVVTAHFNDLSPGIYAVAIHHDENSDKKMNTNFIGWPKEGYGFSNDARVIFSSPVFEAASFDIEFVDKTIRLQLVY